MLWEVATPQIHPCSLTTILSSISSCSHSVCWSLPPLTNGMISYPDPTLDVCSVATHSRDSGYTLNGGSTRTCQRGIGLGVDQIYSVNICIMYRLSFHVSDFIEYWILISY